MQDTYGTQPCDLHAWISPCASAEKYEVGEDVASLFDMEPQVVTPKPRVPGAEAKFCLDIPLKLKRQLIGIGVNGENIWRR